MRPIILAAAALILAACTGGLERSDPEPTVYQLAVPVAEGGPEVAADLLVLRPVVVPALRTERIATTWPGNRVDYYAGARWSGELGAVVQAALVEAIRKTGRMRTVEGDPGRFRATHVLGLEVVRLEADYPAAGAPVARVVLVATVARFGDRRALMTTRAAAEVPAGANTMTSVIAALEGAFGQAASEIIPRVNDAVAADLAGQP